MIDQIIPEGVAAQAIHAGEGDPAQGLRHRPHQLAALLTDGGVGIAQYEVDGRECRHAEFGKEVVDGVDRGRRSVNPRIHECAGDEASAFASADKPSDLPWEAEGDLATTHSRDLSPEYKNPGECGGEP
jgi:hypothetical protein